MARNVKLGMITVLMHSEPLAERRQKLLDLVDEAGELGCNIALLPEFADHHVTAESAGGAGSFGSDAEREKQKILGHTIASPWLLEVSSRAKKYGMVVIPDVMLLEGNKAFNSALVYGPDGDLLGQYRKTHLALGEEDSIAEGNSLEPIETPFGKLGIFICYDINFPEITRCYELKGAELLLWTTMRQVTLEYAQYSAILPARANEHGLPLAVSTYVYETQLHERRPMTSTVYNCFGQVLAGGILGPGVLEATVDLDQRKLNTRRWAHPDWVDEVKCLHRRRRPELYGALTAPLSAEQRDVANEPTVMEFPNEGYGRRT